MGQTPSQQTTEEITQPVITQPITPPSTNQLSYVLSNPVVITEILPSEGNYYTLLTIKGNNFEYKEGINSMSNIRFAALILGTDTSTVFTSSQFDIVNSTEIIVYISTFICKYSNNPSNIGKNIKDFLGTQIPKSFGTVFIVQVQDVNGRNVANNPRFKYFLV
uniref:IPT/TIG domain-containing protein n=1 Tax=viral metagenome TaxID=1070528 RepID=A0A6C0AEQ6_9ZZZZ